MLRRPAALTLGARPVRNCRRLWPPTRSLTHQPATLFIVTKAQRIFKLAQEGADAYRMFKLRRAGAGTPFVNEVINHLKFLVAQEFGSDVVNRFLSTANRQAVDFWLEDEHTIIEMEFDILTSPPVLEKEVFKALLARDAGNDVRQLVLISDPGAALLSHAPTPASIIEWVERWHQIRVQIWDLNDVRES